MNPCRHSYRRKSRTPRGLIVPVLVTAMLICYARTASAQAGAQDRSPSFLVGSGIAVSHKAPQQSGTEAQFFAGGQTGLTHTPLLVRVEALLSRGNAAIGPFSLSADLVLPAPRAWSPLVRPYLVGGFGMYGVGTSPRRAGANAGLGLDLSLGRLATFAELRAHSARNDVFLLGVRM